MVTSEHEGILDVFRDSPEMGLRALAMVGADVSLDWAVEIDSGDLTVSAPKELRADGMLTLWKRGSKERVGAVVLEIQRAPDPEKRLSWPEYLASAGGRYGCNVLLFVICPNQRTADWSREPIATRCQDWTLRPWVLGPDDVAVIDDPTKAVADPFMAVLSAFMHAKQQPLRRKVYRAFLAGLKCLPEDQAGKYINLVYSAASKAAQRDLKEIIMATKEHLLLPELVDDLRAGFEAKGRAEGEAKGRAEGEAEGKAKGKAEAIVGVLRGRGLVVSSAVEARVLACHDLATLDRWLPRALTVERAGELFDGTSDD